MIQWKLHAVLKQDLDTHVNVLLDGEHRILVKGAVAITAVYLLVHHTATVTR